MRALLSGPVAAWATAWTAGLASLDEVVDAAAGPHAVHRLDVAGGELEGAAGLHDLLAGWRRSGRPIRAVLPVAGDVRGLPGPAAFRAAALDAGEAVVAGAVGVVPVEVERHETSSAPPVVHWQAFAVDAAPSDPIAVADAQFDLTTAIRETASALAAADVAGRGDPQALDAARRAGERLHLPPGFPPRAVALLAQAERMHAVLELALADPLGGAVDRAGVAARTSALRPLVTAVRRARVAGWNAGCDETRL